MEYSRIANDDAILRRNPSSFVLKLSLSLSILCSSALAVVVAFLLFAPTPNTGIAVGLHVIYTPEHACIGFLSDSKSWANVRTACRRPAPSSALIGNNSAFCMKEIEREINRPFHYDNRRLISDNMWITLPELMDERDCVLECKYLKLMGLCSNDCRRGVEAFFDAAEAACGGVILDIRGKMIKTPVHKYQEDHWRLIDTTLQEFFGNSANMASSRTNITAQDLRALFFTRLDAKCAKEQDMKYAVNAHVNATSIFVLDSIMAGARVTLRWYPEQVGNNGSNHTTAIKCWPVYLPVPPGALGGPEYRVDQPPPLNNLAPAELVDLECSWCERMRPGLFCNAVLKRAQRLEALICAGNSNWVKLFKDDHFEPVSWDSRTGVPDYNVDVE
ncbi:hypothetical protein M427DRAFT_39766 [Gonapodya prolifera JEL478]|uniref:Uncharacterized protein n=1 Tax=Gonapodya prolifera (strain JEL478) TaxID=1344416 RepID=A0A138ZWW7_GONPJ|nr:hypothetical protein M427DRAFT_39766 [Gonapodya prolifera JEL478]|eukprot:KXS08951.1 hypothetical protein M427DRAFT_39766 [Gonapodya prolifera JEL478]